MSPRINAAASAKPRRAAQTTVAGPTISTRPASESSESAPEAMIGPRAALRACWRSPAARQTPATVRKFNASKRVADQVRPGQRWRDRWE